MHLPQKGEYPSPGLMMWTSLLYGEAGERDKMWLQGHEEDWPEGRDGETEERNSAVLSSSAIRLPVQAYFSSIERLYRSTLYLLQVSNRLKMSLPNCLKYSLGVTCCLLLYLLSDHWWKPPGTLCLTLVALECRTKTPSDNDPLKNICFPRSAILLVLQISCTNSTSIK